MRAAMNTACSVPLPMQNQSYGLPIQGMSSKAILWASVGSHMISFRCQRECDEVDQIVADIYNAIITNNASQLFDITIPCSTEGLINCGNIRGSLSECACDTLNRASDSGSGYREEFETSVINKALDMVRSGKNKLNLAFFASGGMHGEDVLMIKLISTLRKLRTHIEIQIFLIDTAYSPYINKATDAVKNHCSLNWDHLIGSLPPLKQMLIEITFSTPSWIQVQGSLFASAEDYIQIAQGTPNLKYDLLIGADITNTLDIVQKIQLSKASKQNQPAIMLIKNEHNQALLCKIHGSADHLDCKKLDSPSPLGNQQTAQRSSSSSCQIL